MYYLLNSRYEPDFSALKLQIYYKIEDIFSNIEILDFSTDDLYLLYKEAAEEIIILDLKV